MRSDNVDLKRPNDGYARWGSPVLGSMLLRQGSLLVDSTASKLVTPYHRQMTKDENSGIIREELRRQYRSHNKRSQTCVQEKPTHSGTIVEHDCPVFNEEVWSLRRGWDVSS